MAVAQPSAAREAEASPADGNGKRPLHFAAGQGHPGPPGRARSLARSLGRSSILAAPSGPNGRPVVRKYKVKPAPRGQRLVLKPKEEKSAFKAAEL